MAACRLVAERDGTLVLWHPAGSPVKRAFAGGVQMEVPGESDWELVDVPAQHDELGIVRIGTRHSLWLQWEGGELASWYVNLERGHRRTAIGLDLVDEKLDLVARPDGSVLWKDEDELAEAAACGFLDETEVRTEAERILAAPPWPTGWEGFRADAAWPVPRLPDGWQRV